MPQNTHDVPHRSRLPRCSRCFQLRVLPRVASDGLFHVAQHAKRARTSVQLAYTARPLAGPSVPLGWAGLTHAKAPTPPASQPSARQAPPLRPICLYLSSPSKAASLRPSLTSRSAPSSSYNIQPSPSEPP
eukprot:scaffold115849_cov56-Phaeocystis_antarctica.AAC.3